MQWVPCHVAKDKAVTLSAQRTPQLMSHCAHQNLLYRCPPVDSQHATALPLSRRRRS